MGNKSLEDKTQDHMINIDKIYQKYNTHKGRKAPFLGC